MTLILIDTNDDDNDSGGSGGSDCSISLLIREHEWRRREARDMI